MSIEQLISQYGYGAIVVGTFLEGETILVMGGFAAYRGYLDLPFVIIAALIGSLSGDQLFFYIGRIKGKGMLENRPSWKKKSEKVFSLMERHQNWLVLGFRFLYGLRSVAPFLIGTSRIKPLRFLVLNIAGASIWAVVVGILGYLFGQTVEIVIGKIKNYELLILAVLAVVAIIVWVVRLLNGKKEMRK